MESPTEQWLRMWLTECFKDHEKADQFVAEKMQRLNGRVYKYCPIHDSDKARQYDIENIEQSTLHLSKFSLFNDPFDTSLTITAEEVAHSFMQKVVTSGVIKMDRGISRTLPLILMLLPDSNDKYKDL
jgi:hypothetical protein